MFVVKYRKIFYTLSAILVAFSFFAVFFWGLNFGIDFKGGSIIEVNYTTARPELSVINQQLSTLNVGEAIVRPTGDTGFIVRTRTLTEPERLQVLDVLSQKGTDGMEVKRSDTVGPILGQELQGKAVTSIILVVIAIILFITFAFRGVSRPISSWKYGVVAIIALAHDVIIPTGIFAYLGHLGGYEIDALFVTALLVILGFSVHDTIVVFDRTRENLKHDLGRKPFDEIVGESISQTFTRSINTSLTTIIALLALFFFGPEATHNFALALIIGIATGTYSSIFIGSPLLVTLQKFQKK
ncbi:MAG: protein translocase subunit SecF [Candidatus Pacebacteria bacterium]|nr:protein translocase subunit SecF [Candidatus Paceibacterota bacterium]